MVYVSDLPKVLLYCDHSCESTEFPGLLSDSLHCFFSSRHMKALEWGDMGGMPWLYRRRGAGACSAYLQTPFYHRLEQVCCTFYMLGFCVTFHWKEEKRKGKNIECIRGRKQTWWHGLGKPLPGNNFWSEIWRRQGSQIDILGKSVGGRRNSTYKHPKTWMSLAFSVGEAVTKNKSYFVKIASDTSFLVRYFTFIITFPGV